MIVIYHSTNDISGNSYLLARKNGLAEKRTEKDSLRLSDYSLLVYLVEKKLGHTGESQQRKMRQLDNWLLQIKKIWGSRFGGVWMKS